MWSPTLVPKQTDLLQENKEESRKKKVSFSLTVRIENIFGHPSNLSPTLVSDQLIISPKSITLVSNISIIRIEAMTTN